MKNPFRVGERVYLRPIDHEDIPVLQRWVNDDAVTRYLNAYLPYNASREKEFVESLYKDQGHVVLLIVLREGDRPIGNCGLRQNPYDIPNRQAEFGIMIGEKEEQGRGYGTEATRLICDYGFNRMGLHRIWLRAYDYNARGLKCYERAGFKPEGRLRQTRWVDGRWHDTLVYGLLEDEFRAAATK